jgi:HTH-type transcriptional regulator/antitoxin HigA
MEIHPVRHEQQYEAALREISDLMDEEPEPGTDAYDRLDVLVTLVEAYEDEQADADARHDLDPVEVIEFHLDRLGWTQAELARRADIQKTHLSAVMNGRRSLSLDQIKGISAAFDIPPGRLIRRDRSSKKAG